MEEFWNVLHFIFLINTQALESFAFLGEVGFSSFSRTSSLPSKSYYIWFRSTKNCNRNHIPRYNPFTECSVRATVSKIARMP